MTTLITAYLICYKPTFGYATPYVNPYIEISYITQQAEFQRLGKEEVNLPCIVSPRPTHNNRFNHIQVTEKKPVFKIYSNIAYVITDGQYFELYQQQ